MKRKFIISAALTLILVCTLTPLLCACGDVQTQEEPAGAYDSLVIYNWEDYIDSGDSEMGRADLRRDFERYYRNVTGRELRITYTTFDTNETMMTKVLKNDANVDLICPSEYAIEKLLLAGRLVNHNDLLAQIKPELDKITARLNGYVPKSEQEAADIADFSAAFDGMSSLRGNGNGKIEPKVMDVIRKMFSKIDGVSGAEGTVDMTEYMVPYMYGTLGILYNKNVISEEELDEYGWGVLWNIEENEDLEGKILMKDSVRDTYAAALFYMYEYNLLPEKYDYIQNAQDLINLTDAEVLEIAEKVLTEQRDHISGYEVDFGKDDMINEIVYADFAWSGDALWAVEESYDEEIDDYFLGYFCPTGVNPTTGKERFSNIWYDGWVIPNTVNNKLAAMMFIDYMCRPESAIRNSVAIGYSSAASKELLMQDDYVATFLEEQEYDFDEYFDDIGRYPEINAALGVMRDFGNRNEDLVNMWQRAKSGGIDIALVIIIAVIIAAVAITIGLYFLTQAARRRPKKLKS